MGRVTSARRVLMVTSEFAPVAKAGGLADAVAALTGALHDLGEDVRVVMPRYGFIDPASLERVPGPLGVPIGFREEWVGVYRLPGDLPVYLLDHDGAFGRQGIYNQGNVDYSDNPRRFALLSYGAFQLCRFLQWTPEVIHAHDWPTGLVPGYLKSREAEGEFANTRSVFTIHNIGYQGVFASEEFAHAGIPLDRYVDLGYSHDGLYNMLHGALTSADLLTTVSPSYAEELLEPGGAFGMEELLSRRRDELHGVLNGIDPDVWDPERDPVLPKSFSAADLTGKDEAKAALQRRYHLPERPEVPVIGMIGRLAEQKGIRHLFGDGGAAPDTLDAAAGGAVERLCREEDLQVVLLGSGDPRYEERIRRLSAELPNFSAVLGYDDGLAHLIEAGANFFLMPSEYEPCGLNQMYSMRYGTLPIVSTTGGLKDTVVDEAEGLRATGFQLGVPSEESILRAVRRALAIYREQPQRIAQMRMVAMRRDFGWDRSARRYLELYERLRRSGGAHEE